MLHEPFEINHVNIYFQVEIQDPRPVVIFGPLKDKLSDELIKNNETRFQQAIPHTTRPMRENEIEGRDYYFVSKDEMSGTRQ